MKLDKTIFEHVSKTSLNFNQHFHDTYTIGITHNGAFKSFHEGKASYLYEKSTKIINPGELHGGDSNSWKYTNFYPSIELVSDVYEQIYFEKKTPVFNKHAVEDIILYNLLYDFFIKIYYVKDIMAIETSLINALAYLIKNYTVKTKEFYVKYDDKPIIKTSIEYIKESLETNIDLDELAKISKLSKYHYLRTFKNIVGLTPHQFILNQRIEKAKDLIAKGKTLNSIAYETGFSDQSHFIRVFKKIYGYSPKNLQKSIYTYTPIEK